MRWDQRYAEGSHPPGAGPDWISELELDLPCGRALDLASGTGTVALWLAAQGYSVLAVDVSAVGLERASAEAQKRELALKIQVLDLASESLPEGRFDLISCFHYLQRDLFAAVIEALAPGGCFICEIPTRLNLERHARPSQRFLLEEGEILELCAALVPLYHAEGWFEDRGLARFIGRRTH